MHGALPFLVFGIGGRTRWIALQADASGSQPPAQAVQESPEQLQQLVAPIALYPDTLIAQILAAPTQGWMQVGEIYGLPQNGSPPIGLDVTVTAGQVHLALFRDATHDWDMPWQGPPLDGHWHTVAMQVGMSTDPTAGFVSIYYDGVVQLPTLRYATMVPGVNDAAPNRVYANNYRKRGWLPAN